MPRIIILIGLILAAIGIVFYFSGSKPFTHSLSPQPNQFTGSLATSPDTQHLVFGYKKDNQDYLYLANPDGSQIKPLPNTLGAKNPSFSIYNQNILFTTIDGDLNKDVSQLTTHFKIIDLNGNLIKDIPLPRKFSQQAIFGKNDSSIIFINAGKNKSLFDYQSTDYDILQLNLESNEITNLTNKNYIFPITNLMLSPDGSSLYAVVEVHDKNYKYSGPYLNKFEGENYQNQTVLTNYVSPHIVFSPDHNQAVFVLSTDFTTLPYLRELFLYQKNRPNLQLTDLKKGIVSPVFLDNQSVLFFVQKNWGNQNETPDYQLMQVNIDGSSLKEIPIQIP